MSKIAHLARSNERPRNAIFGLPCNIPQIFSIFKNTIFINDFSKFEKVEIFKILGFSKFAKFGSRSSKTSFLGAVLSIKAPSAPMGDPKCNNALSKCIFQNFDQKMEI